MLQLQQVNGTPLKVEATFGLTLCLWIWHSFHTKVHKSVVLALKQAVHFVATTWSWLGLDDRATLDSCIALDSDASVPSVLTSAQQDMKSCQWASAPAPMQPIVLLVITFLQSQQFTLQQNEEILFDKMEAHLLSQLDLLQQAPRPAAVKATPYIPLLQSVILLLKLKSLLCSLDVDDSVLSTAHNMLDTAVLEISQNAAQIAGNALPETAHEQACKLCLLSVRMAIGVTKQKLRMKSTMRPALNHLWICRMLGLLVPGYASGIFVNVTKELLAKGGRPLCCYMLQLETCLIPCHLLLRNALP